MGSFESEDANYMTCGKGIHNSITHINKDRKTRVDATWRAPDDFEGSVVFKYSLGSKILSYPKSFRYGFFIWVTELNFTIAPLL